MEAREHAAGAAPETAVAASAARDTAVAEPAQASGPGLVGVLDAPRILALQATAGNRAVGALLARQPLPGTLPDPIDRVGPRDRGSRRTFSVNQDGRELSVDEQLVIVEDPPGELSLHLGPELRWLRRVHIRTETGATADVTIRGSTRLHGDTSRLTPEAAVNAVGDDGGIGAVFEGRLADGTPVRGLLMSHGDNTSLGALAGGAPEYVHFALTPGRQYQSIVDAMNQSSPSPATHPGTGPAPPRPAPAPAPSGQQAPLTRERLHDMSEDERADEFWDRVWDRFVADFTLSEVLIAIGIGVVVGVLGALAIIFGTPLAIGAFIVAAVLGVGYLLYKLGSELIDDLRRGDVTHAIIGVLKNIALIGAAVLGALAVLAAAGVITASAGVLTVLAFVALGAALLLMGLRLLVDRDRAVGTEDPQEFERSVQDGARTLKEGVITIITTIISLILGPLLGRFGPRGRTGPPGTDLPPGEGEGPGGRGRGPGPDEPQPEAPMPRTGRPTPAAREPVPPRLPNGEIDFAAWQARVLARGIRGDVAGRIARARAGDADAIAEITTAERYAEAGYEVEIVAPEENAGVRNPDLRLRLPGTQPIRAEVKSRIGRPLTRNSLNEDVAEAGDQLTNSREGRGDIVVDASQAPEGPFGQQQVENFLRGRMGGNRFAPGSRLRNVDRVEVIYRDGGVLKRSWIQRNANGDTQPPVTEIMQ